MGEEPEGLAGKIAWVFVLRDVTFKSHGRLSKGYSSELSVTGLTGYVFGGMCLMINMLARSLSGYSLLE
jgi:hypothetical protein